MLLVFMLGVLRRDKPAPAAGMIAIFFYGSMLLTTLAREPGVSWQSHLGVPSPASWPRSCFAGWILRCPRESSLRPYDPVRAPRLVIGKPGAIQRTWTSFILTIPAMIRRPSAGWIAAG
ncbi:MAG: hypothetical protein LH491_01295 [Pseudoxanthomonas sp.]|nr:hypothetical protein [Pseudoxanthomonas sp.]